MSAWALLEVEASPGVDTNHYTASFFGEGEPNLKVVLYLRHSPNSRPEIVTVEIEEASLLDPPTKAISPSRLRDIPFGLLTSMAETSITDMESSGDYRTDAPAEPEAIRERFDVEALRKEWPSGDLDAFADLVTEIYLSAYQRGLPPKETVANFLETSTSTAGRMIAKARQLGKLKASSVGGRPKKQGKQHGQKETRPQ